MPRTTLSDLSVEIHHEILKHALYSSQCIHATNGRRIHKTVEWKWIEQDRGSLSQFPYNVAAVSHLWQSILTTIPECWTRVIIDVATDPHKLLDIFLWSKELPKLEVTIFNSRTSADPNDAEHCALERERVSMIVKALSPHIYRCEYIEFDIAFLTSLPSPVVFLLEDPPNLKELILVSEIDNAGPPDVYARGCDLGARERIKKYPMLPKLEYLSITGFWFMFIAGHRYTRKLFKNIRTNQFQCSISQFQFQKEGKYTLENFVIYFSHLEANPLTLSDLSLDNDGPVFERDDYCERIPLQDELIFENVTADVLESIFYVANVSSAYLTFDNCVFPDTVLSSQAIELTLKSIPHSTSADPDAEMDTANISSILEAWSGSSLSVESCPSFDDDAFEALLSDHDNPRLIYRLRLFDCNNFTVRGLQKFIETRNQEWVVDDMDDLPDDRESGPMESIDIDGTGRPFLSEEEKEWFRTSPYAAPTMITWSTKNPENFEDQQIFVKHRELLG